MKHNWRWLLGLAVLVVLLTAWYVHAHPLVFNESFWTHAHCMKIGYFALLDYADSHDGKFPQHSGGYGNALLLLREDDYLFVTGPGYDVAPFREAKRTGAELAEHDCGRVYVQGLTRKSDSRIVILFDKLPTPGGDHCHIIARLLAPLGREVTNVSGEMQFIQERNWSEFSVQQVELLVGAGFPRAEAERLYASKPRTSR